MAWRAFVDEQTPEGLHIIFTNDDSLDATTIREAWDAPNKAKGLRRFGKVARLDTQADVEAFCKAEIAALEAAIMDEPTAVKIRAMQHPSPYWRTQGKTYLDYIQYFRGLGWASNTLVKLFDGLVKRGICEKLPRANAKKTNGQQQETEVASAE